MGFWSSLRGSRLNRLSALTFALPFPVAWITEWDGKEQPSHSWGRHREVRRTKAT